eukprot:1060598-Rhodomonas_salina.1
MQIRGTFMGVREGGRAAAVTFVLKSVTDGHVTLKWRDGSVPQSPGSIQVCCYTTKYTTKSPYAESGTEERCQRAQMANMGVSVDNGRKVEAKVEGGGATHRTLNSSYAMSGSLRYRSTTAAADSYPITCDAGPGVDCSGQDTRRSRHTRDSRGHHR